MVLNANGFAFPPLSSGERQDSASLCRDGARVFKQNSTSVQSTQEQPSANA